MKDVAGGLSVVRIFLLGFAAFQAMKILFVVVSAVSTGLVDTNPPRHNVVAVAATGLYSNDLHFFCEEGERYYECTKDGLGDELIFQKGEKLTSAVGIGLTENITFYCITDSGTVECTPKKLVNFD